MINHNLKRSQNLYLFVALFFLVFASFSTSALAQSAPLRVAVDAPYPPFAYYDENKALTGFDVDIATALCIEMKRECEIKAVDFDQMIPDIVAGKLDLAVAGMAATEHRRGPGLQRGCPLRTRRLGQLRRLRRKSESQRDEGRPVRHRDRVVLRADQ